MPLLDNAQHERFATRLAAGAAAAAAYIAAGYSAKGAASSAHKLQKNPKVRARVRELRAEFSEALAAVTITDVKHRVEAQQKRWLALQEIVAKRAIDPDNVTVAGGDTGHLARTTKILGSGAWAREVQVWEVDTGLLAAILALEEQAAVEMGQRNIKAEVTVNVNLVERLMAGRLRVITDAARDAA